MSELDFLGFVFSVFAGLLIKAFIFLDCLTKLKQRSFCPYVNWVNTREAGLVCAHCERSSTTELPIDYLHDFAYWHYIHATPEFRRLVRETVRDLYANLFEIFDWLGQLNQ